jgi:uncharacterized Fe-S cluster protein YjdI
MSEETRKEYSNGELTVVWKPGLCIHSGICVKTLPAVYKPSEKPWIRPDQASTSELKNQISQCPSGALSYFMNGAQDQESLEMSTAVEVRPNGPLLVYGTLQIKDSSGQETIRNKTTAFCRCGASANKPYCDGSHLKAGFQG